MIGPYIAVPVISLAAIYSLTLLRARVDARERRGEQRVADALSAAIRNRRI